MWGTFGIIGFILSCIVLYYIIRMGVEDGVLDALKKYEKIKNAGKDVEE